MRYLTAAVAALVITAGLVVPLPALGQQDTTQRSSGTTLSGAISAQQEATSGQLDNAVFGERLKNAETEEERAAIIKERQSALENRSKNIKTAAQRLGNGTVDGKYLSEAAKIAQSQRNLEESANQTERAAKALPDEARENAGINVTALEELRKNASTLSGPEIAEVATGLAGNGPAEVGPPDDRGEGSESADEEEDDDNENEDDSGSEGDGETPPRGPP